MATNISQLYGFSFNWHETWLTGVFRVTNNEYDVRIAKLKMADLIWRLFLEFAIFYTFFFYILHKSKLFFTISITQEHKISVLYFAIYTI